MLATVRPHPVRPLHILVIALVAGWLALMTLTPASASCHIAAFDETEVTVDASAGSVTLTVFLQGRQPSCEGSVTFETQDGSAVAGTAYTATDGTLTFASGDDREETIEIAILAGGSDGDSFSVVLTGGEGGISPSGTPATVTISSEVAPDATPTVEGEQTPSTAAAPQDPASSDQSDPPYLLIGVVLALAVGGAAAFVGMRRRA